MPFKRKIVTREAPKQSTRPRMALARRKLRRDAAPKPRKYRASV